jgi:hypothetical protein
MLSLAAQTSGRRRQKCQMYNNKQREKKSRNELTNSLRNVDAGMAMLLRIGLMRKENWPNLRV